MAAAMTVKSIIDVLNNLTLGEISRMRGRVVEARADVEKLGHAEIVDALDEALAHLDAGDIKAFRKRVQHAVSRLGHTAR